MNATHLYFTIFLAVLCALGIRDTMRDSAKQRRIDRIKYKRLATDHDRLGNQAYDRGNMEEAQMHKKNYDFYTKAAHSIFGCAFVKK